MNTPTSQLIGQRTLAAIAFSDIVGFSALMGKDEVHTLHLVERDFRQMTDLCQKFAGKVLKTTGDGLLMYFASAVQAVECTREMQTEFAKAAKTLPVSEVLSHRIGIHLGDVFFNETDVMGNGVNIAARLQAKAEVGGICISQAIYDVVKHRLDLDVTYLGELELKNIQDPIPAYQILIPFLERSSHSQSNQKDIATKPTKINRLLTQQDFRDRQIMLNKVRNFWVEGVLETSIHDKALIELGLQTRLDAIAHPWHMEWATSDQARKPLPTGTKEINQFDSLGTGRTLLILGDPGAGKTTTLLELTRELIARAERDSELPMPIVFNLSSWQDKQSLADWMVLELNIKYQVPKKIGKVWVSDQQILAMLDGLDEVSSDRRNACVEAINRFHDEYGQTEIVVCSRMKDYEALAQRLQFQGAIFIQPLEEAQVFEYFDRLGAELEGVREMLTTDAKLLELAKTPLMANIMAIAYRGMSVTDLIKMSLSEDHVRHLFDAYIDRMLRRRPDKNYSPSKVKKWLGFLAQQLKNESQTVFLIERIQPSWLTGNARAIYATLTAIILAPIIALIVLPSSIGMLIQLIPSNTIAVADGYFKSLGGELPAFSLMLALANGLNLYVGVIAGSILLGFIIAILWGFTYRFNNTEISKTDIFIRSLACPFIVCGLGIANIIRNPLWIFLFVVLGFLSSFMIFSILEKPIKPTETLKWSWKYFKENLSAGRGIGLIFGLIAGVLVTLIDISIFLILYSLMDKIK
ncbi:adenylate/guanylate cyclase domain-containing protein [Pseudanabaena minima]|uniref:adenylate/guanylate cyclase domain-containing protein n=1 Tax=Pseudanabaena minima TaxID=890415 RepID=UPI003DA9BCF2